MSETTQDRRAQDRHREDIERMIAAENDPQERAKLILFSKMFDILVKHGDQLDAGTAKMEDHDTVLQQHINEHDALMNNGRGMRMVLMWILPIIQALTVAGGLYVVNTMSSLNASVIALQMSDLRIENEIAVLKVKGLLLQHDQEDAKK